MLFTRTVLLAGPLLAACALLVLAGAQKVLDPAPLVRAGRSVNVPLAPAAVRVVAAGEVALGLWAAGTGAGPAIALVAVSYAVFTAFVLLALRRGGVLASCGCFGRADTPPTRTHAAVTAALAGAAAGAALGPVGPPLGGAAPVVPLLLAAAALAATAYATLAVLPLTEAAR